MIPFISKCHDGENRRVDDCLSYNNLDITRQLSEDPGILSPHVVQLTRHAQQQGEDVRHGQVGEVDVGGGPHGLVVYDHETSGLEISLRVKIQKCILLNSPSFQ